MHEYDVALKRILTRPGSALLGSEPDSVRRVLQRVGASLPDEREAAPAELLIIAGLRNLQFEVRQEAKLVPIQEDIMDHGVIGPAIRQGLSKGLAQGRREDGKADWPSW